MTIGNSSPRVSGYFDGYMSSVRVYNKGLSPDEVWQNYENTKNRFTWEQPSIITDGLVLHLDAGDSASYPGSGTTWTDLSGNGNNFTLVNGVGYSSSNGGTLTFDGSNDVAQISSFELRRDFTLQAWVYYTGAREAIFGQGTRSNNNGLTAIANFVNNRGLVFTMYNNDLDYAYVGTNIWQMFTFTYSHSTYRKQIYINNALVATNIGNAYTGTGTFRIGQAYSTLFDDPFLGNIPIVTAYSKILSSTEVTQNYNVQKGRFGL
jgi:hypothetical protein